MNVDNLKILADWLEANREWIERENRFDMKEYKCGTVHCALGWATYVPEFNCHTELLTKDGDYYLFAMKLFELTGAQFMFLFSPIWSECDNTIQGAFARIRYLIAGNPVKNPIFWSPELYKSYLPK